MTAAVLSAFVPMRDLPDRRPMPAGTVVLTYRPIVLAPAGGPLELAGAWELQVDDSRFGGLSALASEAGRLLAVTDRGAMIRFDPPFLPHPAASLSDMRQGPGRFGKKWARDAESLARDPRGRGWWVGYEQYHSLWLYDRQFRKALDVIDLPNMGWRDNRGAEGLLVRDGSLLVLGENGRDAFRIEQGRPQLLKLHAGAEVADAAQGPDGSSWILLRENGAGRIRQSIAQLRKTHDGYSPNQSWPLPKGAFDNYEGMAITSLPDGNWRFWLVTDDGHRVMARTLLVALDLRHDKSPATGAGLSKKPPVETP